MKYGFGIDIGGTKISVVLGSEKGRILTGRTIETLKHGRVGECVKHLISVMNDLLKDAGVSKNKIAGIGVGIPGAVNPESGRVPDSPNLKGWKNYPLKHALTAKFKVPVRMTNDGNAAAVGEKVFGQGRGKRNVIYITVSTGVGAGLIINNKLTEGSNYVAGEVGHMTIIPGGNLCNCGQSGCLEAYASGTAIAKFVKKELSRKKNKTDHKYFPRSSDVTAKTIGAAAKKGHPLSVRAFREAGFFLGVGVGNLLNLLNPETVILGGGVLKSAPKLFWTSMMRSVKKHSWPEAFRGVKIVKTKLGDNVGNLGALSLVFADKEV